MNSSCKYALALLFFVCFSVISYGQSKKEQIEILKMKLDSIENVTVQLNKEVQRKKIQTDSLQALIQIEHGKSKKAIAENAELKEKLKKEHESYLSEEAELKREVALLKNDLEKSRKDIQLQSDSIRGLNSKQTVKNFYDVVDFSEASNFEFIPRAGANSKDFNGVFKSYYNDNVASIYNSGRKLVYATGQYLNGLKNGVWTYYNCDGSVAYMGNYVNGLRVGKWKCLDYCFHELGFLRLTTMLSYYNIDLEGCNDISKLWQSINYTNGQPSDTIFIENLSGKLVLQIIKHGDAMHFYYDNKQALCNQALRLDSDGFLVGAENAKDLKIYNRKGGLKYTLIGDEHNCEEVLYYSNGGIATKCIVKNDNGNWTSFDEMGRVTDNFEMGIHEGKYGIECICQ